ncbi:MAG: hypothetical protein Q4P33_08970 [Flaviflexus sp.]|nr:hypothetical protein [Flaviflexus sp.]
MATNYYELLDIEPSMTLRQIQRILAGDRATTSRQVEDTESEAAIDRLLLLVAAEEVFASEESREAYDSDLGIDREPDREDLTPSTSENHVSEPALPAPPAEMSYSPAPHPLPEEDPVDKQRREEEIEDRTRRLEKLSKKRSKEAFGAAWRGPLGNLLAFIIAPIAICLSGVMFYNIYTTGGDDFGAIVLTLIFAGFIIIPPIVWGKDFRDEAKKRKKSVEELEQRIKESRQKLAELKNTR